MTYLIDYDTNGKILGWLTDKTVNQAKGTLQEVTRSQWKESQKFNKIVIDGDNISFDNVVFETSEELEAMEIVKQVAVHKKYLSDTDFKMTVDYFDTMTTERQLEIVSLRATARAYVKANED